MPRPATFAIGLLLASFVAMATGCFNLKQVFGHSRHWVQWQSTDTRLSIDTRANSSVLEFKKQSSNSKIVRKMTCLKVPAKGRYMIEENHDGEVRFRCVRFSQLSKHVVKMFKTPSKRVQEKVNCLKQKYEEDRRILLSQSDIKETACPLHGGFQLIMDESAAISADCRDTIHTYNPRLQFQCDSKTGGRVVADFGDVCKPKALPDSGDLVHLNCLGSWTEKRSGKKNSFTTILLGMRDSHQSVWCLNYMEKAQDTASEGMIYPGEKIYKMFLNVDGRCIGDKFADTEEAPEESSIPGFFVSYRPSNDKKCKEAFYTKSCEEEMDKCLDSTECPSICNRCKKPFVTEKEYRFDDKVRGKWSLENSEKAMEIEIKEREVKSDSFGTYQHRAQEKDETSDSIYPVAQKGTSDTCMPSYACMKAESPAPGVLNFHLRPAERDEETGDPLNCASVNELDDDEVPAAEKTLTLLNSDKLKTTRCNRPNQEEFQTSTPCPLVVDQCDGSCSTLTIHLKESCSNDTRTTYWPTPFEEKHRCHATFTFLDGVVAILTSSKGSRNYACWIYQSSDQLYITEPEMCNQDGVNRVLDLIRKGAHYGLLDRLTVVSSGRSTRGGGGNAAAATSASSAMLFGLIMLIMVTIRQ